MDFQKTHSFTNFSFTVPRMGSIFFEFWVEKFFFTPTFAFFSNILKKFHLILNSIIWGQTFNSNSGEKLIDKYPQLFQVSVYHKTVLVTVGWGRRVFSHKISAIQYFSLLSTDTGTMVSKLSESANCNILALSKKNLCDNLPLETSFSTCPWSIDSNFGNFHPILFK
jgi:hypothetical protein